MSNQDSAFCKNPYFTLRPPMRGLPLSSKVFQCAAALLFTTFTILASGCNETVDPNEEKRQRFQVDNTISSSNLGAQPAVSEELPSNTGIAVEGDVDSLMARSQMLQMRAKQVSFKEMIADLALQQQISERLLQLNISEEQRVFAVHNLFLSLLKRIDTSDLEARETLYEILPNYQEDRNPDIQRLAWTAKMTAKLDDFLRIEDANPEGVDQSIDQLLSRFPSDPVVATELQGIIVQFMIRERRDKAIELMGKLTSAYANSPDPNLRKLSKIIKDRMYLAEIQFDVVAQKMRQGQRDTEVQQQFINLVKQLAAKKDMGDEIYREILWTERWLEEIDDYDAAEKMLLTMEANLATHQDAAFRTQVADDIAKAKARLALVGKPLLLTGQDSSGKPLTTEAQKGSVTLVIFWSARVPSSVKTLQQLVQVYRRYRKEGLEIVSFCIDENAAQALSIIGNQPPPWVSMYRSKTPASQEGIDASGVQQVPYLILLNKEGVVIDVNLSIQKMPDELERVLKP